MHISPHTRSLNQRLLFCGVHDDHITNISRQARNPMHAVLHMLRYVVTYTNLYRMIIPTDIRCSEIRFVYIFAQPMALNHREGISFRMSVVNMDIAVTQISDQYVSFWWLLTICGIYVPRYLIV